MQLGLFRLSLDKMLLQLEHDTNITFDIDSPIVAWLNFDVQEFDFKLQI